MEKLKTIDEVSFNVTENCSFECPHCIRGDRRRYEITKEVIDAFLSQIEILGSVLISGGEPLLKVKLLSYLINKIYEQGNNPSSIKLVTNGSVSPQRFEEYVKVLHSNNVSEADIIISNDYYHLKEMERLCDYNVEQLAVKYAKILRNYGYPKYWGDILQEYQHFGSGWVLAVGSGVNIPDAKEDARVFDFRGNNIFVSDNCIKGEIVLHTDGRILPAINISWEEIDRYYSDEQNILKHSLRKILTRR